MKVREVIKHIEADGWVFARYGGRSSHRIYEKPGVPDKVVVPGIGSDEVSPGVLQDVRRKSGLPLR